MTAPEQTHFSNTSDSYVIFDEPAREFEPGDLSLDCQKTSVTLDAGAVFCWPLELELSAIRGWQSLTKSDSCDARRGASGLGALHFAQDDTPLLARKHSR
jgi:hypothetical protein